MSGPCTVVLSCTQCCSDTVEGYSATQYGWPYVPGAALGITETGSWTATPWAAIFQNDYWTNYSVFVRKWIFWYWTLVTIKYLNKLQFRTFTYIHCYLYFSNATIRKILRKELKVMPSKFHRCQELSQDHKQQRLVYCNRNCNMNSSQPWPQPIGLLVLGCNG